MYFYILISLIPLILSNDWFSSSKQIVNSIKNITFQLSLLVIIGFIVFCIDLFYLGYIKNSMEIVFGIVIPIFWIIIVSTNRIMRFAEKFKNSQEFDCKIISFFDFNFFRKDFYNFDKSRNLNLKK